MPELPEVETVLRTLETQIQGEEILDVTVRYPKMIDRSVSDFTHALKGRRFETFARRGKYLLFGLGNITLVSHLRMEGKYYIQSDEDPVDKHTHVIFQFSDHRQLRYHDTRKFGTMELIEGTADLTDFHGLGLEPFDEACDGRYLYQIAHKRNVPVKSLLLDQSVIAGIGNIYADEICFACHIRPGMSARRLTRPKCQEITDHTREILAEAIRCGGTTIRSYTSSLGVTGRFQLECNVHAQKQCRVCGGNITVKRIGGRSSYYCANCQKS